jgi:transmembrane sensor
MDELIDRARRGEASAEELERLNAWRSAAPENGRAYRDVVRLLDAGQALGARPSGITRPSADEIVARVAARRRFAGRNAAVRWAPWAIAAAATIVAVASLRARTVPADVPGWGATEVVTGAAELATVQLGEGSVVRLAPSSRLRVLAGRERAVSLEGRAFFAVQRIAGRPLRVHTRAGEARVLGTRFELASDGETMHVRVVEGRVALTAGRGETEVGAGEESGVRNGAVTQPTTVASPTAVASWVGTFLAFQATPLAEVGREIERVYRTPVTIVDSTLARETITATFTDRPVQEVVNVVCSVLNARCDVRDGRVRIDR